MPAYIIVQNTIKDEAQYQKYVASRRTVYRKLWRKAYRQTRKSGGIGRRT
jgi:uncharacterized protein (DUF1330 family)